MARKWHGYADDTEKPPCYNGVVKKCKQFSAGLENAGQHLHIEVRKGRQTSPAGLPTIDEALTSISPYDYL